MEDDRRPGADGANDRSGPRRAGAGAEHAPVGLDAAAAAVGGVIGAAARWWVGVALDVDGATTGAFPWHTLIVNLVGCLAIGLLAAGSVGVRRTFVVTGVLGGFTTMSTFAVEANDLAESAGAASAAIYVATSVGGGLLAVIAGDRLADRRAAATTAVGSTPRVGPEGVDP